MSSEVSANYGWQTSQDSREDLTSDSPLKLKRELTDKKWLSLLGIFVIWCLNGFRIHWSKSLGNFEYYGKYAKSYRMRALDRAILGIVQALAVLYIAGLYYCSAKTLVWRSIFMTHLALVCTVLYFGYVDWQFRAILGAIILASLLIYVLVRRKKIDAACEVIGEYCKALTCVTSSMGVTIFSWIFTSYIIDYYEFMIADMVGINEKPLSIYHYIFWSTFALGYTFVGLWILEFILGIGRMALSMSYGDHYWPIHQIHAPNYWDHIFKNVQYLTQAIFLTVRYHAGTVVIGSLQVLVFMFVNMWKCVCRSTNYVDRKAYVMTAMDGTKFSTSVTNATNIRTKNLARFDAVDKVSGAFLRTGEILIMISALLMLVWVNMQANAVFSLIRVYVSIKCVFMTLEVAMDSLLILVIKDMECNDGSEQRPFITSDNLRCVTAMEPRASPTEPIQISPVTFSR